MDETIRAYEGTGVLRYADGTFVECNFSAGQNHDGTIWLYCFSPESRTLPHAWLNETLGQGNGPNALDGETQSGIPVHLKGQMILSGGRLEMQQSGSHVDYALPGPAALDVGASGATGEWRFGVTNLLFESPEVSERDGGWDRCVLRLQLGPHAVRIERVGDSKEVKKLLKGRHGIRVTAEITIPEAVSFDTAEELVADLCALLSIAQGTLISWVYCDQLGTAGERAYSHHYSAVTRPYNGALPLISPDPLTDLPRFLEATFERFQQRRVERELRKIARAYADNRTTGFLESRCLTLLSLTEFIVWRDAVLHREGRFLSQEEFESRAKDLKPVLREVLTLAFPTLDRNTAQQMTDHIPGWNYTTLRQKLKKAGKRLGVLFEKHELDPFVETRDGLVHKLLFRNDEPIQDFYAIASVLDRLIMGLLGYDGPYIDVWTFKRTRETRPQQDQVAASN